MLTLQLSLVLATAIALAAADATVPGKLSFYTSVWEGWDEHVSRWSTHSAPTFSLVFKPETEDELSQGIAFLSSQNIRYLATKAAGHGNVPTLGAYRDVVQISLDNFRHVTVNPDDHTVTVGGGARMVDLIPTLHAAGREMTVGSFPCVGVHGVMLGGGMGRLMGKYGLISDAMQRATVALWNGTIVEVSEDAHADLFWGLRGAGHNLAVVLDSTYTTWPDQGGIHYNADMVFTDDSLEGVVDVAQGIIEAGLDPAAFLIIGYMFDAEAKKPLLVVNLVCAHDEKLGRRLAAQFASTEKSTSHRPITRVSFSESNMNFTALGAGDAIPGVCDVNLRNTLYTASAATIFDASAMRDVYASYGDFVRTHPAANRSILLFEAASGEGLAARPDDFSAYPHRGRMTTNAIIQLTWDGAADDADGSLAAAADAWGRSARDRLAEPAASGYDRLYAYVNYANRDEPLAALYGYEPWRQERLTRLKQKYDPHGFFNAYRPLPSELSGWGVQQVSSPEQEEDGRQGQAPMRRQKDEL